MVNAGTGPGVKAIMALDGYTSMERAAVANTGTLTSNKTHGMKDTHIMDSTIALRMQFNFAK